MEEDDLLFSNGLDDFDETPNPKPHELIRPVSLIDMGRQAPIIENQQIKRSQTYMDIEGVELELSLFQKVTLYD